MYLLCQNFDLTTSFEMPSGQSSKAKTIDEKVSVAQATKAVDALLKYTAKKRSGEQDSSLLDAEDQNVWLVITTKTIQNNKKMMPHRM